MPNVEDIVKVGDEIMVKVIEIDSLGRINLSRRAVLDKLSQIRGSRVKDSLSTEHPFRPQRKARPPQRPHAPRAGGANRRRG